jgi:hypothetical protein
MKVQSPQTIGGTPVGIHVYVPDVDARTGRHCRRRRRARDRQPVLRRPHGHARRSPATAGSSPPTSRTWP